MIKIHLPWLITLIGFITILPIKAEDYILENSKNKKWEKLLGTPPAPGSEAENQDFDFLIHLQNTRTAEECEQAQSEVKMTLENFYGTLLSKNELQKNSYLFLKHSIKTGLKSRRAKNHFDRPRPFQQFSEIKPCIHLSSSKSYPSGHTALARVVAYALSKKYPERKIAFFKRADEIAYHRMLGGVHYPTDVIAGKKLADEMMK
jgi:acid phosphatase (class A)